MLVIAGGPGIGKTHHPRRDRRDDRGCIVLRGSAGELEREYPFALLVDALDRHLAISAPPTWAP